MADCLKARQRNGKGEGTIMNSIDSVLQFLSEKWYLVLIILVVTLWNFIGRETDKDSKSRKCEFCLSAIDLKATTCKHCGKDQKNENPKSILEENVERALTQPSTKTWSLQKNKGAFSALFIVLVLLVILFTID